MFLPTLLADAPHARAAMRVEVAQASPGRPFLAAVEIDTDPHWHIYWRNPGDSGIPTQIDWSAPKGWRVEPMAFPTPRRFAPGGVTAYGYEGRTLFLARVTPTSTPGTLSARVKWLVCSEACVPGGASLMAKVPLGRERANPWARALQEAVRALPQTMDAPATATIGKRVTLTVSFGPSALPAWCRTAEFFPVVSGIVDQAKPFLATLRNRTLVLEMSVSPFPERHDQLPGLVVFSAAGRREAVSVSPRLVREAKP